MVLGVECKAKVCDFGHSLVDEDVGNFEITVDNIFGGKVLEAFVDVGDNVVDFPLLELVLFLDPPLEVSLVAQLGDDVAVSIAGEDLEAVEHVGVVHLLEHFDL